MVLSAPPVAIPEVEQERDRLLVQLVETIAVVTEPSPPIRIGAPGRRLGDEAGPGLTRDLGVAVEVVAQASPAVRCLEQHERGELWKLDAVVEDQLGLETAVGEERSLFQLRKRWAVIDHRGPLWLSGSSRSHPLVWRADAQWGSHLNPPARTVLA